MTSVLVRKTEHGFFQGFTCIGHSEFAESGEDIVCAAVSVLVINTVNSLEELTGEKLQVTSNEEEGLIDCRFLEPLSDGGMLLMNSMILGLTGIENQYGSKFLTVKFEEV